MFILRAAFAAAVVIMLLPTDEKQQANVTGQAGLAMERAATFCERNVATCAAGAELWATFVKKAEFGAKLAGNMIQDYMKNSARQAGLDPEAKLPLDPSHRPQVAPTRGTLGPSDLQPAWRGGITRTGT